MSSLYPTPAQSIIEFLKVVAVALIIAVIIRTFVIQPYVIPSGSMLETLQIGDRIFVSKFSYGLHIPFLDDELISTGQPKIGDIIVFPAPDPLNPNTDYVKRVEGLGGDTIEIKDKQLYRNGKAVQESYIQHSDPYVQSSVRDNFGPVTVPSGNVFVMGDNRDDSRDSRFWGFVEKKTIHGKAMLVYWSSVDYITIKWDRIGKLLH